MHSADMGFLDTTVYWGDGDEAYVYSAIPSIMEAHRYPNEIQWSMITMLGCVLQHADIGVDIGQDEYTAGFRGACETMMARGEDLIKEQAIKMMAGDGHHALETGTARELQKCWSKSAVEVLANHHKRAGVELDRAYQEGLYIAYQSSVEQAEKIEQEQVSSKGSGFDVEF